MLLGFLADLHIKLGQKDVPIDWAKNRYSILFTELEKYNSSIDKWVIGGDVFDKVPTVEELAIYFDFISIFKKPTIIYSGNHEALKKDTTFLSYLKNSTKKINNLVDIIDDFYTDELGIDYIPYNRLKMYNPSDIDFHGDILCTHVRGEIPPHVKPEVNLDLFSRWKVVLAGDLHSYNNCQRNILYPGSPVSTSFHRSKVATGFIIIDTDTLEHEWKKLKVPQLLKLTVDIEGVSAIESRQTLDADHVVYEVEGNISELSNLVDHDNISKKVLPRAEDTGLVLESTWTIEKELEEYLKYILMIEDSEVEAILKEFANVKK